MTIRSPIPLRPDVLALEREMRLSVVRAFTCQVLAQLQRKSAGEILRRTWGADHNAELLIRAPATPTDTIAGAPLAHEALAPLVLLAPSSAALRLFDAQPKLGLGQYATIRIPGIGTPPVAAFVPEGGPAPLVQAALAAAILGPIRKIVVLSALTEELQDAAPENAAVVIGRLLSAAAAKGLDAVAFDSNPGDTIRPPGLLHGVTPLPATTGSGIVAMSTDVGNLAKAMAAANVDPEDMLIVAAPRQAVTLRFVAGPHFDLDVFGTTGLADGTIVGFARGAIASSFQGVPTVEVTKSAELHFAAPAAEIVTSAGVVASPARSLFQDAMLGVRLRQYGCWCVTTAGSVQMISGTSW